MKRLLADVLLERARSEGERVAFVFSRDGTTRDAELTYRALAEKACGVAARLTEIARPGDRVVIASKDAATFVPAFYGCLIGGYVAVPYPAPTNAMQEVVGSERLKRIVADCGSFVALTDSTSIPLLANTASDARVTLIDVGQGTADCGLKDSPCADGDLALLQYTSGTTGVPKGVRISHGNLSANCEQIREEFELSPASRGVFWLPHFHDMGLVGGVLNPVYIGFPTLIFPPTAFLQKPLRWLQAISEFRATLSGAPDFAYRLAAARSSAAERVGLNLETWTNAFNGAEAINSATLQTFHRAYERYGLQWEALFPCYGLAEATLLVACAQRDTGATIEEFDRDSILEAGMARSPRAGAEVVSLVSSGVVRRRTDVRIVSSSGVPLGDGQIGEIVIHGEGVTDGYWGRDDAELHFNLEGRRFLRTGDLGFVLSRELFVTGRIKDVMTFYGRQIYCADVEDVVRGCYSDHSAGSVAATSMKVGGQERMLVFVEVSRADYRSYRNSRDELRPEKRHISSEIRRYFGVVPLDVYFVKPHSLPRTTSGKIQRQRCVSMYQNDELQRAESDANTS